MHGHSFREDILSLEGQIIFSCCKGCIQQKVCGLLKCIINYSVRVFITHPLALNPLKATPEPSLTSGTKGGFKASHFNKF